MALRRGVISWINMKLPFCVSFRAHLREHLFAIVLDWWLVLIHTRTHRLKQLGSTDFPLSNVIFAGLCFDASTDNIIHFSGEMSISYIIMLGY
jgi:hypothetical protein